MKTGADDIRWARWATSVEIGQGNSHLDLPIVNIAQLEGNRDSQEVREFLQVKEYKKLLLPPRAETMLTVYESREINGTSYYLRSSLAPLDATPRLLEDPHWYQPDFKPWAELDSESGSVLYDRWWTDGQEPLVLERDFYGVKDKYLEVSEEFRVFHNLYQDKDRGEFIKISDNGEEYVVAKDFQGKSLSIRCRELKEFLTIKQMALGVSFAHDKKTSTPIADMGITSGATQILSSEDHIVYVIISQQLNDWRTGEKHWNSRFIGKKIFFPYDDPAKSNFGDFKKIRDKFEKFIVKTDENDEEISSTCDPNKLHKFAEIGFLTPISFKREVLDKYRNDPKYELSAGHVRCGGLWYLPIDTGNLDKVCVFLGDLGEKLPYSEQKYWRNHNITSEYGMSEWFFKWQHLNIVDESPSPEFYFISRYKEVAKKWEELLGWKIFIELSKEDMKALHGITLSNNQQGFDSMILTLTKCLCDAINKDVPEMSKYITSKERKSGRLGSITVLDRYLASKNIHQRHFINTWLKNIQDVRSKGVAHPKNDEYPEVIAKFKLGSENIKEISANILAAASAVLDRLEESAIIIMEDDSTDRVATDKDI